jgi:hypothetical protein
VIFASRIMRSTGALGHVAVAAEDLNGLDVTFIALSAAKSLAIELYFAALGSPASISVHAL